MDGACSTDGEDEKCMKLLVGKPNEETSLDN
jgi:hypothetical protein